MPASYCIMWFKKSSNSPPLEWTDKASSSDRTTRSGKGMSHSETLGKKGECAKKGRATVDLLLHGREWGHGRTPWQ